MFAVLFLKLYVQWHSDFHVKRFEIDNHLQRELRKIVCVIDEKYHVTELVTLV